MYLNTSNISKSLPVIRIKQIHLENFKNVKKGDIVCECGRRFVEQGTEPDIVGLYGQNGSGKTTIIQALALLQNVVFGLEVTSIFTECINADSDFAYLSFTFDIQYENGTKREAVYSFKIGKKDVNNSARFFAYGSAVMNAMDRLVNAEKGIRIFDECIQMSGEFYGKDNKRQTIIDTSSADSAVPFGPVSKRKFFVNAGNKNTLNASYISAEKNSSSFIFASETMDALAENKSEYFDVLADLYRFVTRKMYILTTKVYGAVSTSKVLPFYTDKTIRASFNTNFYNGIVAEESRINETELDELMDNPEVSSEIGECFKTVSPVLFMLSSSNDLVEEDYFTISSEIKSISNVLSSLIPGKEIFLKVLGESTNQFGKKTVNVEIMLRDNGKEMPLRYESDGTLKLISMLKNIVLAYNDKSVTVAIDEIDSGVYEYLLGELLQVFEEGGRGQLFFTSHNLRPLEVLSKKYLYFTTTDENNRYVHIKNVGATNNLRNVYYREILNMEGNEIELYSGTEKYKIAAALRKAGANG